MSPAKGFDSQQFYQELALPPQDRQIPMILCMTDAGLAAFEAWQQHAAPSA